MNSISSLNILIVCLPKSWGFFPATKKKKKKNETSCTSAAAFSSPFLLLFLCWCAKWRMEWLLTHYYVSSVIHRKAPVIFTHNYFYTISETINSVKRQKSLSIILKTILTHGLSDTGFPGGSAGKKSTCNTGDLSLIPGLRRSPREGKGYPLQYSGLENSMDCSPPGSIEFSRQKDWSGWSFPSPGNFSDPDI